MRRKGIYLLPNLLTTGGLFAGFYAITAAMNNRFEAAAIAIFVAMLMDALDGRVARMTNTQSDFGAEYDSLADMVSFGIAPALVIYEWSLHGLGKPGFFAAFVYTGCAALRLARFNTQVGKVDKRYFQGLASPSAAAVVAGMVWLGDNRGITGVDLKIQSLVITFVVGVLMVSNFRYHSFKDFDLKGRVPFMTVVAIVLVFAFIYIHPPSVLFTIFLLYTLSGPAEAVWSLYKRKGHKSNQESSE